MESSGRSVTEASTPAAKVLPAVLNNPSDIIYEDPASVRQIYVSIVFPIIGEAGSTGLQRKSLDY